MYVRDQRTNCHNYKAVLRQGIASTSPSSSQQLSNSPASPVQHTQPKYNRGSYLTLPSLLVLGAQARTGEIERLRERVFLLLRSAPGEGV